MPERDSTEKHATFRRSPRFLPQNDPLVTQDSTGKPIPESRNRQAKEDSDAPIGFTPKLSPKNADKVSREKVSRRNLDESNDGLRRCADSICGSRRSPRLTDGAVGIQCLRRSPRFLNQRKVEERVEKFSGVDNHITKRVFGDSVNPQKVFLNNGSRKSTKSSTGSRKSSTVVAAGIQNLMRSSRFSKAGNDRFTASALGKSVDSKKVLRDSNKLNDGSRNCSTSSIGLRKSSRLNAAAAGIQTFRRSLRFLSGKTVDEPVEKTSSDDNIRFKKCVLSEPVDKEVLLGARTAKVSFGLCEGLPAKGNNSVCLGMGNNNLADDDELHKVNKGIGAKRKRNEAMKTNGLLHGWTEEQELALHNAYFDAKPTPHFWKKVAKMVPGKSAQECFDKVHSGHSTPPQPRPRSRGKRMGVSSPGCFLLSASKVLKPTEPNKRVRYNKQRSHLTQKTIRKLLQKSCQVAQDCEVDLFSVLEPTTNPSARAFEENVVLSTPNCLPEKLGLYGKCHEKSSLGHKKQLSRFGNSTGSPFVSPPVLKQVKNQALHEKYIAQLHCREAKRKAAYSRAAKSFPGKSEEVSGLQKMDVVRAAKSALVSDAQDAINQFQHKQTTTYFSELDDDDGVDCYSEGEDEL